MAPDAFATLAHLRTSVSMRAASACGGTNSAVAPCARYRQLFRYRGPVGSDRDLHRAGDGDGPDLSGLHLGHRRRRAHETCAGIPAAHASISIKLPISPFIGVPFME
ncbi:MAG: hypothetical protein A3G80_08655 [Betaproteobacteria bacterium RIFCSPLOWO2_12_FULL_62_13b]|nr:MAG: hypothetical protein A3G80_08655 [Betaproteobacteria bacterium RIFCSPLOWO2_12_FULL_62_13b]